MTADARYSYSSDRNRVLLLALIEAWGNKCYWCRRPKTFRDMEIDHIVPRNPHGRSDPDCDVDAAENLAPICSPCNKEKNNGEFEGAPRIDAMRKAAVKIAPKVRRNLERFYKDDAVVKALLAVTAADLASPDVAEAISAFGAAIMPVFRERFPEVLTDTYTWDYTPPLKFRGEELPVEQSIAEFDAEGQRALVVLEDVIGISMADAIDYVRGAVGRDVDEQINLKLRDGMDGHYLNSSADEPPSANGLGVFVSKVRYEDGSVVLDGQLDGTFIVELEEYGPNDPYNPPERWSTYRKADFDFTADFSVTFCDGEVSYAWVDVTKLAENEWRGRASRMLFDN